ncbi:hypothetical protein CHS0354_012355 [Potamilus streckersoni]|uniref:Uncharacterized protein n=1 Tax=Potamilus streckersoni TaxID=2493646 RepID=A0AAE0SJZ0_9BIVA|nr:hypothetical protein CHS0354_012355 [Potamilus streckersoni]
MSWNDHLELAAWLTTNYQQEVGGMIRFQDIYNNAMEFFVPPHLTPSKKMLSRMITSLFPESKRTVVFTDYVKYSCCIDLVERSKISTEDTPVLIPNECKAGKDSLGHLMITCPTLDVVNGKIVTCTLYFGKTTCLMIRGASLKIHQQIDFTQNAVDGLVYLCENLKLCKGRRCDEKYLASENEVKEDWSRLYSKNEIDKRVRSGACKIIAPWTTREELCTVCRLLRYRKRKAEEEEEDACIVPDIETSEDNKMTPVERPSMELEPNGTVADSPEVILTANADAETDKLLKAVTISDVPERFNILLESQLRNNEKEKDPRHRRWNQDIINLCLNLYSKSPSAYQELKSSGFLTLPSKRLLQYYKNSVKEHQKNVDGNLPLMVRSKKTKDK